MDAGTRFVVVIVFLYSIFVCWETGKRLQVIEKKMGIDPIESVFGKR